MQYFSYERTCCRCGRSGLYPWSVLNTQCSIFRNEVYCNGCKEAVLTEERNYRDLCEEQARRREFENQQSRELNDLKKQVQTLIEENRKLKLEVESIKLRKRRV